MKPHCTCGWKSGKCDCFTNIANEAEKSKQTLFKMAQESLSATKHDSAKPDLTMLPYGPLQEIVKVMEFGKKKYGRDNWRLGMEWTRPAGALLRHTFAWIGGEDKDPESGLSHLAHAGCNVLFLLEYVLTGAGEDDRVKPNKP